MYIVVALKFQKATFFFDWRLKKVTTYIPVQGNSLQHFTF